MSKQLLKKRYTKSFAETYEVPTSKRNYRALIVLYPLGKGDPFYDGDIAAIDKLDERGFFVTVYPYDDLEEREILLNGLIRSNSLWQEVDL